jgi:ferritin-like metal-binding protein YciE
MTISSLQDLFVAELSDLYSAEKQILGALPEMIQMANDEELKEALQDNLEVTRDQVERLNEISQQTGIQLKSETCEGMAGILKENKKMLGMIDDIPTKDAAIIGGAQRVEHYEMAGYGVAVQFARDLDMDEVADMLQETLDEEKDADEALTGLAKGGLFSTGLNEKAKEELDDEVVM